MSGELSSGRAVFLSYASQDAEAVRGIAEALRASGVEVWFDQNELVGGDAWDAKIRKQIRDCALFVPMISANTEARLEGYFRLEWKLAEDRSHLMAKGKPFIVPVTIDVTTERDAHVPDAFVAVQWTRLPGGERAAEFAERVKSLLEMGVAQASPPAVRAEAGGTPALPRRRAPLGAVGLTIVVVALVGVGAWKWLPRQGEPEPDAKVRQDAAATQNKPRVPAISDKSLVVLPLENLSPDPENAFFTEAIHTEIIETLTRLSDLKVIRRGSALAFKGSTAPLAEIAQKLGVANVITGSVQRAKDRIKISLELRRASDEAVLWGPQTFERSLADQFAIQTDIAGEVSRVLRARESKGSYGGAQFRTKDPRAYDLFVKARAAWERNEAAECRRLAEDALNIDPTFVSAAGLLSIYYATAYGSENDPGKKMQHALDAKRWAETASRLMPGGAGDSGLAYYYSVVEPDSVRAVGFAQNAVRALPNDASAVNGLAIALNGVGRIEEALVEYRRSIELDPLSRIVWQNYINWLSKMRRGPECVDAIAKCLALPSGNARVNILARARYLLTGELPDTLDGMSTGQRANWLWLGRRFDELISIADAAMARPDLPATERLEGLMLQHRVRRHLGRTEEAKVGAALALTLAEELRNAPAVNRTGNELRLAWTLALVGRGDEAVALALRCVNAFVLTNPGRALWSRQIELAEMYANLGRTRECVQLLSKLLRVPSGLTVPTLRVDPSWDNVREDAGFKALLADPNNSAPL